MGDLTKNFSRREFACRCGCGYEEICIKLVEKLQVTPEKFGPIHINSACRCVKHNQEEGGGHNSSHLRGWAVDIRCRNSFERFFLVKYFLQEGFSRIGIGETFIHVDLDPEKPDSLIWLYPPKKYQPETTEINDELA